MGRAFVLAPGPSMSQALADRVRGQGTVVAVNNVFQLAPWADALVANDREWWRAYPEARKFAGQKFCTKAMSGVVRHRGRGVSGNANSGMLGIDVALEVFKATEILLLGFDFQGTHFFGEYTNGLGNTKPESRQKHHAQMKAWRMVHPNVKVINCTPGSALTVFPMGDPDAYLPAARVVA